MMKRLSVSLYNDNLVLNAGGFFVCNGAAGGQKGEILYPERFNLEKAD
jgi:hypothetical protein